MSRKQLGFDPTIVATGTERYIEIEKNGMRERLIIDEIVGRARCVAGRATTCWKVYCETDKSRTPLVVKDSWQYPERTEEGELLREAMAKGVKNVARYYHHETVRIDDKDDDVLAIRKGLSLPISKDEKGGFKATVRRINVPSQVLRPNLPTALPDAIEFTAASLSGIVGNQSMRVARSLHFSLGWPAVLTDTCRSMMWLASSNVTFPPGT
ncbi:predicted protein [Histoplasma mississippiense (nom. inval.)]|uniref:predicted protein n=1 Tax=Ajellomyces capsulatus (strain NAm1 / WU24) TaxID=2059318 RepID=UPI000157D44B|nr:predicted protein [Histoplasma mississippiense (nom. inval.)]EDN06586.1 predicted protein [Histoplasma mississippiense (nom. inval.)]